MTKNKMDRVQNNIDPQIANSLKSTTNFIEWNIDMNVTVSNVKKSKLFQRSRGILFFIVVIVLAIALSHLRKEVHVLQVQMQSVNANLLLLMSKYDRLNRSLNRVWLQRSNNFLEDKNMRDIKRLLDGASSISRVTKMLDEIRDATNKSSYAYNSIIPYFNSLKDLKDKYWLSNNIRGTNKENDTSLKQQLIKLEDDTILHDKDETNLRIERAVLTIEKHNITGTNDQQLNHSKVTYDNVTDDDYDDNYLDIWRESRSGRTRRDGGRRGKNRGKNKRRPKRSRRRLEPLVATFVGAIPEQHVTDTVYIGPWVRSTKNNTQYSLNKFHLVEDKRSIEITATGLYIISAQIFYFGESTNYSYWILLSSEGKSTTQKLVKCSTSSTFATEVSCYTSIITPLQRGDRVHIQQQERDRLINMREGYSYIQLVLLSNNVHKRRLR